MIRINLLPKSKIIGPGPTVQTYVIFYLIFLAVLASGLAWCHFYLKGRIENLTNDKIKIEREIVELKKKVEEIEQIKKDIALLEKKLDIIDELEQRRREAFLIFDTMTRMLVENRMWFTNFDVSEKVQVVIKGGKQGRKARGKRGKGNTPVEKIKIVEVSLYIKGIALDNKTVADFMTNLENELHPERPDDQETLKDAKYFKNIQLIYVREKEYGKLSLKSFEVRCQLNFLKKDDTENTEKNDKKKK